MCVLCASVRTSRRFIARRRAGLSVYCSDDELAAGGEGGVAALFLFGPKIS